MVLYDIIKSLKGELFRKGKLEKFYMLIKFLVKGYFNIVVNIITPGLTVRLLKAMQMVMRQRGLSWEAIWGSMCWKDTAGRMCVKHSTADWGHRSSAKPPHTWGGVAIDSGFGWLDSRPSSLGYLWEWKGFPKLKILKYQFIEQCIGFMIEVSP